MSGIQHSVETLFDALTSQSFIVPKEKDKVVNMNWKTKETRSFEAPGLSQLTGPGYFSIETEGRRLFVTGGRGSEGRLAELRKWEGSIMSLEMRADMLIGRKSHCLNKLEGDRIILATGGTRKDTKDKINSCEIYELEKN
jgi:hypothetical protein